MFGWTKRERERVCLCVCVFVVVCLCVCARHVELSIPTDCEVRKFVCAHFHPRDTHPCGSLAKMHTTHCPRGPNYVLVIFLIVSRGLNRWARCLCRRFPAGWRAGAMGRVHGGD